MMPDINKISNQKITLQVSKIRNSGSFQGSERLSSFLEYIVQETCENRGEGIKAWSIAVNVFNRPNHFDAQTDSIVRVYGGKLRRALNNYYHAEGKEDEIVISIPKGRYQPIIDLKRSHDLMLNERKTNTRPTSKQVEFNPSIAVMMFELMNGDSEDFDYLATGLTEEMIISLTHFPGLKVIGPLYNDIIRKQHLDSRGVGEKYNVRFILSGSIRKINNSFRLTANLKDTKSRVNIWGRSLNYKLNETTIEDIEKDLVSQVVGNIADTYGVIPRTLSKESSPNRKNNLAEYEVFLRVAHHFRVLTAASHRIAMESLEELLQRDPDNSLALAQLSDLFAATFQYGFDDSTNLLDKAEKMARKALALDPNCQHAHYTMALVHFLNFRTSQFLDEADRCLKLNPNNGLMIAGLSFHIAMAGEWENGLKLNEKAMELNPHHPGWYHVVPFMNHYRLKEYDLALDHAMSFNTPDFYWDALIRAAVLGQMNKKDEGKKAISELLILVPDFKARGRNMIKRFAYQDENVEMLLEGLRQGGLEVD